MYKKQPKIMYTISFIKITSKEVNNNERRLSYGYLYILNDLFGPKSLFYNKYDSIIIFSTSTTYIHMNTNSELPLYESMI